MVPRSDVRGSTAKMHINDLVPAPGSRKKRKRVGRGNGSGHGSTSGRGDKGQGSRAGGTKGAGFEGGQTPLAMRLPKLPGFKNRGRVEFAVVNVSRLDMLFSDGDVVDSEALVAKGIIKSAAELVKVLGDGELGKKLTVRVDKVSGPAKQKIEAAGGTVETSC
jgi:large subunit ribosomal protein L15